MTIGGPGGMVNKFRNATMDVWQRGTTGTVTTSGGYTADGWIVLPTGASATWAQAGGRLSTKSSLQVTGASSVTDLIIKQRIESLIAAAYCSQTVTVQAQVYNNTGGSITPKLTVNRPSAQDNYGTVTADVNAVSLQSCGNGAWTQIAYTFSANAASYNGLEIVFDFGNNFSSSSKDYSDHRVRHPRHARRFDRSQFQPAAAGAAAGRDGAGILSAVFLQLIFQRNDTGERQQRVYRGRGILLRHQCMGHAKYFPACTDACHPRNHFLFFQSGQLSNVWPMANLQCGMGQHDFNPSNSGHTNQLHD